MLLFTELKLCHVSKRARSWGLACSQFSLVFHWMSSLCNRGRGRLTLAFMAMAFMTLLLSVRWFVLQPSLHRETSCWPLCPSPVDCFPRSLPLLGWQYKNWTHPLLLICFTAASRSRLVAALHAMYGRCTTGLTCPRASFVETKRQGDLFSL